MTFFFIFILNETIKYVIYFFNYSYVSSIICIFSEHLNNFIKLTNVKIIYDQFENFEILKINSKKYIIVSFIPEIKKISYQNIFIYASRVLCKR